jgi:CheY-like chemotaxis protein
VAHEINNPASFVMANLDQLGRYANNLLSLARDARALVEAGGGPELKAGLDSLAQQYDVAYIEGDMETMITETLEGMVRIRNIVANLGRFASWGDHEVEEVEVNLMVDSVLNLAMSEIRPRGRLVRNFGDVPAVRAVQGRLANAVLNLVVNAAQSLDQGRAEHNLITVTTGMDDRGVHIQIADTGCGISPEVMPKIFDPFFTTKKAGVGTGLGLVIAQDIIHKMGGEITVTSQAGQGSVFTIRLPLDAKAAQPAVPRRQRILVIDDEAPVLKAMSRILGYRFDVALAASAEEALATLNTDPDQDLVICDLIMPGHDGQYLYNEAIRQWPRLEPRFLFFTGGAYPPTLKGFSEAMKNRTIHKPLEAEMIKAAVERMLPALSPSPARNKEKDDDSEPTPQG